MGQVLIQGTIWLQLYNSLASWVIDVFSPVLENEGEGKAGSIAREYSTLWRDGFEFKIIIEQGQVPKGVYSCTHTRCSIRASGQTIS